MWKKKQTVSLLLCYNVNGDNVKELAISIRNYNKDNYKQIINSIKEAGFKNVFIEWYNDDLILQEDVLNYVREVGLNIIFAHLGYQRPHVIWNEGSAGEIEIERYMKDITICKNNGIDLVIIHPTFQYEKQELSQIGINRIKRLIKHAELNNVKIAYENVELNGYLEYIIDNINSNNLGICFDTGHCHLFYDGKFNVNKFENKVFTIHMHDNFKTNDDHNLPFDGTVDWENSIKQIIDMSYNGYIVIESGFNNYYKNLSLEDYYKLAYDKGLKLKELFDLYEDKKI